jgi:glyoxylase-like metal-dependent hydrolase (beta-lactamase superfamily II)
MGRNTNSPVKITHVYERVWCIQDSLTTEKSNAYLITGNNTALLFDTGPGSFDVKKIVQDITNLPVKVVLSHWHHDHAGGAYMFDEVYAWDTPKTRMLKSKGISLSAISKLSGKDYADICGRVAPVSQLRLIDKEISFNAGGVKLQVLHVPGHTEDSICLYEKSRKWLFTGDIAYKGPVYSHLEDSDLADYLLSIQRLQQLDNSVIFPGHNEFPTDSKILDSIKLELNSGTG